MGFPVIFIFDSSAVVVFSSVLQMPLKEAIEMKSENDLTMWGEEYGNYN